MGKASCRLIERNTTGDPFVPCVSMATTSEIQRPKRALKPGIQASTFSNTPSLTYDGAPGLCVISYWALPIICFLLPVENHLKATVLL